MTATIYLDVAVITHTHTHTHTHIYIYIGTSFSCRHVSLKIKANLSNVYGGVLVFCDVFVDNAKILYSINCKKTKQKQVKKKQLEVFEAIIIKNKHPSLNKNSFSLRGWQSSTASDLDTKSYNLCRRKLKKNIFPQFISHLLKMELAWYTGYKIWKWSLCNGYCRRRWTRWHEFKPKRGCLHLT